MAYHNRMDGLRHGRDLLKQEYYDAAGHMIVETDGSGNWQRAEIYAGGRHLATWNPAGGGTTYFNHADWLGTERARSDSSGNRCETITSLPFGDGEATSGSCTSATPNFFTGLERDSESGLDHTLNRQYPSSVGRWLTADDFHNSKVADPQSWNEYAYAENKPTTLTDPTGQEATVTTSCPKDSTICQVTVRATIAIYSVNGTTDAQLRQAQAAITSQADQAWSGSFTQDGRTYNVKTDVTVSVVDSEKAGVDSGAQNVIGIDSSGKTTSHIDTNLTGTSYDTGRWDYHDVTTGKLAPHEFSHVLGLDDNRGEVLSNSLSRVSMGDNPHATAQDYRWAFGPELSRGRTNFNVGAGSPRTLYIWRGNAHWWEKEPQ